MSQTIGSVRLFYARGGSDKFYEVGIEREDSGDNSGRFIVWTRYGRRYSYGRRSVLREGLGWDDARDVAQRKLDEKVDKGYTTREDGNTPCSWTEYNVNMVIPWDRVEEPRRPAMKKVAARKVPAKKKRQKTAKERADEMRRKAIEEPSSIGRRTIDFDEI